MRVFTDERLTAMRDALQHGLGNVRFVQNARFTAVLSADQENLVITVDGERSAIDVHEGEAPSADFGLAGSAAAWEGYLSGDGKAEHRSPLIMATVEGASSGVLTSELVPEGNFVRLMANYPILGRLLESAATPHGA